MINQEKKQTPIIERRTDYKPRRTFRSWLIGRPLSTADAAHETIGKRVGLAVFASDALSSNAYATQEILVILAIAGMSGFQYVFPISIAIGALLVIVAASYRQVIFAYPQGGGGYIVAKDNLGEFPALVAASSLLMDYVLVVSVSISSGIAQISSAFPIVYEYRVAVSVAAVALITILNLRGLRET
ncbi:MAG: amino acid permease, partial [Anaerolineales bacterium]